VTWALIDVGLGARLTRTIAMTIRLAEVLSPALVRSIPRALTAAVSRTATIARVFAARVTATARRTFMAVWNDRRKP
jgi:hypothetical protein